jgi:hypothetical protein
MKYVVKAEVSDYIRDKGDINHERKEISKQLETIKNSGKLIDGGVFADARAFFFSLEIEKAADLYNLLGAAILDNCRVTAHPILSFDELNEFYAHH